MSTQEKVVKETKEITTTALRALVEAGKTKEEIGAEFGLNAAQTSKLLKNGKDKGIKMKIKRVVKPAFVLIEDENEIPVITTPTIEQVTEAIVNKKVSKAKVVDDSDLLQITNKVEEASIEEKKEDTSNDW